MIADDVLKLCLFDISVHLHQVEEALVAFCIFRSLINRKQRVELSRNA